MKRRDSSPRGRNPFRPTDVAPSPGGLLAEPPGISRGPARGVESGGADHRTSGEGVAVAATADTRRGVTTRAPAVVKLTAAATEYRADGPTPSSTNESVVVPSAPSSGRAAGATPLGTTAGRTGKPPSNEG